MQVAVGFENCLLVPWLQSMEYLQTSWRVADKGLDFCRVPAPPKSPQCPIKENYPETPDSSEIICCSPKFLKAFS